MNSFALSLEFIGRFTATQKWPIGASVFARQGKMPSNNWGQL